MLEVYELDYHQTIIRLSLKARPIMARVPGVISQQGFTRKTSAFALPSLAKTKVHHWQDYSRTELWLWRLKATCQLGRVVSKPATSSLPSTERESTQRATCARPFYSWVRVRPHSPFDADPKQRRSASIAPHVKIHLEV